MGKLYRIDIRNRITLPDDVLKKINAKSGDYVEFQENKEDVKIKKVNIQS